ncbi:fumarate reductase iron-sulfur subunit [Desulfonatronovibrio magnus]|uniref:fumarate reductase iron-sulfur subunit n=1 Tax=Desulfonatronovibrio magnus TaxID=698827 RepID=UPI0005EAD181|nr:fumarate reductase iron-sulfur subunit [Desulfonatronovibrio magnus]
MARKLTFSIFRYNPADPDSKPEMKKYYLTETENLNLFVALNKIREEQDPSIQFDFCCRAGICGACAMVINGRPGLACHTKVKDLPDQISLMPLPGFKLVGDLSVDTGTWFRSMNQKIESWVHTDKKFDPEAEEERMDNDLAEKIYELDRCIECGCCIGACATAQMREDFLGAVALNRISRFIIDPRDKRQEKDYFEVVGTDQGIFGCMGLLGCEDVCPKDIPLQDQLAFVRRKMGFYALKKIIPWKN